jgi:hypothetical protein
MRPYSSEGVAFLRHLFICARWRLAASIFSLYDRGMEVEMRGRLLLPRARNFSSRRRRANALFLA